jgi:peptide/nickel transport system permease protein
MSLRGRIARRVAFAVFAAYAVISVLFALVTFTPNPAKAAIVEGAMESYMSESEREQAAQEALREFRQERGLNEPVFDRYIEWLIDIPTLDWGQSYGITVVSTVRYGPNYEANAQVTSLVADALPHTLWYVVPAMAFAVVGGLGIGLYTATHQDTLIDRLATSAAHFGFSLPNFWLAEMVGLVVLGQSGWLAGLTSGTASLLSSVIFPAAILGTTLLAGQMRYARAQSLEYADAEFIKLLRAKGANKWHVARHLLRNAAIPLLALFFTDMIGIVVLNIFVIEFVFQIPGLGGLSLAAFQQQDLPVILGTSMVIIFFGIGGNLLQDIAYFVLDPRVGDENIQ